MIFIIIYLLRYYSIMMMIRPLYYHVFLVIRDPEAVIISTFHMPIILTVSTYVVVPWQSSHLVKHI